MSTVARSATLRQFSVYLIHNILSGVVYVGKTSGPPKARWRDHCSQLRRGVHANVWLRRAWAKDSASAFEFSVIEAQSTEHECNDAEIWFIAYFRSIGVPLYNMRDGGQGGKLCEEARARRRGRPWTAQQRALLGASSKQRFASPEVRAAHGERRQLTWRGILVAPDGTEYVDIVNIKQFSRAHGLLPAKIAALYHRTRLSHAGWHLKDARPPLVAYTAPGTLIAPTGERYVDVCNLTAFARDHGLSKQCLHYLVKGQIRHHKGWLYYPPIEGDE